MRIKESLYRKFDLLPSGSTPKEIFRNLSAFWQHFSLYKRPCDRSGREIVSVYPKDCPYPVWHRDEWIRQSDPPGADYQPGRPFFEQLWDFFCLSPIPHNIAAANENCEYTDDWWYGKNGYLSHSGLRCLDVAYCYRNVSLRDCQFCVFSFDSERSVDLINSSNCYGTVYALNSRECRDSAFLFDCRNCSDCLFSWNLRNKQYCLFNKQLTKEDYVRERQKYDFSSRKQYENAKLTFFEVLRSRAWWKHVQVVRCENSTGDQLIGCKNCEECYMIQESEDCTNVLRGYGMKDVLNVVGCLESELVYMSVNAQNKCYDIRFCIDLIECRNLQYSAHCMQCKDCFGCCGLVGKQYYIFNKPYTAKEYERLVKEILKDISEQGDYGKFFPAYFAACGYDDSLAGFHWPLSHEEQRSQGFRVSPENDRSAIVGSSTDEIPDSSLFAPETIMEKVFWDDKAKKPFRIRKADLDFCRTNKVPLNNQYYLQRLKENFRMIFFDGELRPSKCAKTGIDLKTSVPSVLDNRIVSEEVYLKIVQGSVI